MDIDQMIQPAALKPTYQADITLHHYPLFGKGSRLAYGTSGLGGAVHLLPAIPDQWTDGEIKGLKARGGFEVDMQWRGGKITQLTVHSALGGNCRLRLNNQLKAEGNVKLMQAQGDNPNPFYQVPAIEERSLSQPEGQTMVDNEYVLYDFETTAGEKYAFTGTEE